MGFRRSGKKYNISDRRRICLDVDNHGDRDGSGPEVVKSAYIESTNVSQFSFGDGTNDSPFSVSIWFNVPSFSGSDGYKILVGKFDFNGIDNQPALPNTGHRRRANEWFLALSIGNNVFGTPGGLFLYDPDVSPQTFPDGTTHGGGGNSGAQLRRFKNMQSLVQVGQWHHFCATYTGNPDFGPPPTTFADRDNLLDSGIELYFDGANVGGVDDRTAFYNSMTARAAPLTIAAGADADTVARSNNFPMFGEGKVSDCSIFDKSLSASEVLELYEAGRGFDIQEFSAVSSVISHFPLGNGDTLTSGGIKDTVGGQHGSPVGQHASDGLNLIVERV